MLRAFSVDCPDSPLLLVKIDNRLRLLNIVLQSGSDDALIIVGALDLARGGACPDPSRHRFQRAVYKQHEGRVGEGRHVFLPADVVVDIPREAVDEEDLNV